MEPLIGKIRHSRHSLLLLGDMFAGAVAVPAYPPPRNRSDARLLAMVDALDAPKVALTIRR